MKTVKLSSLKDAETFFLNKYSKIEYEVVRREKGGITLISATISARTYSKKTESLVFIA